MSVADTPESPLVQALRQAVAAAPDQPEFRIHLAEALIREGATVAAVTEIAEVLRLDPASAKARELMSSALAGPAAPAPAPAPAPTTAPAPTEAPATPPPPPMPPAPPVPPPTPRGFDWEAAEAQLDDVAQPERFRVPSAEGPDEGSPVDAERPTVTLADVGGLQQVKDRLNTAFLAPMRNPELRKLYGKSLRGGLLLYGPPGCGKTFIARAVAGELGASFIAVGISDVLDMWTGSSEKNLHEIFQLARRQAPCVVFFDEVDALGQRRSQLRHSSSMRNTVNQFLQELDSVDSENEGVFVLAATNSPWDVDNALRRPGRFDRTVLVLPPDQPAREQILQLHLRDRPIQDIDVVALAERTDGFSGADLSHLCETATERALMDSVSSGEVRLIDMNDFEAAVTEVKPSTKPWFESAKSVVLFANEGGFYDDLVTYLREKGMLR